MEKMQQFRFWCQKVLPLVYDQSLSYYELLCKITDYINKLIEQDNQFIDELDALQKELAIVQEWINNFDTSYIEEVVSKWIATMVFFGLTDSGYFVAYIPETWEEITFRTTGLDIDVDLQPQFGHLVLLY